MNATVNSNLTSPRGKPILGIVVAIIIPVLVGVGLLWKAGHNLAKPKVSIFDAARGGDDASVQAHVLTGTPVNSLSQGHTPLYLAAGNGDVKMVEYLLKNGASPNGEQKGRDTPLDAAALSGSLPVVKDLIQAGADLHPISATGETPLHAAAAGGNTEIVKLLLDKGLAPSARRKADHATPLCEAASGGHSDSIRALAARGASIDERGFAGRSALILSLLTRHRETAQALIRAGADVNRADDNGVTPLDASLIAQDFETARILVPMTRNLNAFDRSGFNAIFYAAQFGAPLDLDRKLIDRGCSLTMKNRYQTPISIAGVNGNQAAIDLFKSRGEKE